MRHLLHAEGFNIRLRPVRMEDAAFIVWLRNLDYVKGKVGDSPTDVAGQEAWLRGYFERGRDYYLLAETRGEIPVGTDGIYDVAMASAEAGRFIIRADVPAAVPTSFLASDLAYTQMGLTQLRATVVASNRHVHSYIRRFGFRQVKIERAGRVIGGKAVDMVHFVQTVEDWLRVREQIRPLARLASTQVAEWEKMQFGKSQPYDETPYKLAA
jgi:RimJ/RimL family protein N-acetyltransferase